MDYKCTIVSDYLTGDFLHECIAKRLLGIEFACAPSGTEYHQLTEDAIFDFFSFEPEKDGRFEQRSLELEAVQVTGGFFKRLIEVGG